MVTKSAPFVPFSGPAHSLISGPAHSLTEMDDTRKPKTNCCCRCITVIWDAFVCLLVRIRNCFCRSVTPPELSSTTTQVTTEVEEEDDDLTPSAELYTAFIALVRAIPRSSDSEQRQKLAITQQGLALFTCLSLTEKYFMLEKMVTKFEFLGLTHFFPQFFRALNDESLQDKIRTRLEASCPGQDRVRKWLNSQSSDRSIESAVKSAFIHVDVRALVLPPGEPSVEGDFVQQLLLYALDEKEPPFLEPFAQLSKTEKLKVIDSLIRISGKENAPFLQHPDWIIRLINALPEATKRGVLVRVAASDPDLVKDNNLVLDQSMTDIISIVYPSIVWEQGGSI